MDDIKKQGKMKKVDAKNKQYRLRMNNEESALLDYLSVETGKSKADIIRESIKMYGNIVKYSEN